jgi:hypothetical protein
LALWGRNKHRQAYGSEASGLRDPHLTGLSILVAGSSMMDDLKRSDVPRLTVQQGPILGYEANLQGTLAIDASTNCLVVRSGEFQFDVAWPKDWSVAIRDGSVVLVNAAGEAVGRVGEPVSVVGGNVPPAKANSVSCTNSSSVFAANGLM